MDASGERFDGRGNCSVSAAEAPSVSTGVSNPREISVPVYECSLCRYITINKSNCNSHIKHTCAGGVVKKRKGIVRVLDLEEEEEKSPSSTRAKEAHERELEKCHAVVLRQSMDSRAILECLDERVTFFLYRKEGHALLMELYAMESLVDQFLYFIKFYTGNGAAPRLQSIAKYGRQGKSVIVKRRLSCTLLSLRRCTIVDLLIELYKPFHDICASQPSFRGDVPEALKHGAKTLSMRLESPLHRDQKKRALCLKDILDTRRHDDDVMHILIDQFPLTLAFATV
jgi:hypothetical protein